MSFKSSFRSRSRHRLKANETIKNKTDLNVQPLRLHLKADHPRPQIPDPDSWTNPGTWIPEPQSQTLNHRPFILDPESQTQDFKFQTPVPKSKPKSSALKWVIGWSKDHDLDHISWSWSRSYSQGHDLIGKKWPKDHDHTYTFIYIGDKPIFFRSTPLLFVYIYIYIYILNRTGLFRSVPWCSWVLAWWIPNEWTRKKGRDERVPEPTAKAGLPGVKVCLSPRGLTTARYCWTS